MKNINGIDILSNLQELTAPDTTVLSVIDMQNEVASSEGGYAKRGADLSNLYTITPTIEKLLQSARKQNIPIIYAEFIHRNKFGVSLMDGPSLYGHRNSKWVSDVVEGSWETKTIDELAPQEGDIVIEKSRGSCIHNTYFDNLLKSHNAKSVVLTGAATGGCIFQSAMDIMTHGYYPVIVSDAVAQFEMIPLLSHQTVMQLMRRIFPVFESKQILSFWQSIVEVG